MPSPLNVERSHEGRLKVVAYVEVDKGGTVSAGIRVGAEKLTLQEAKQHRRAVADAIDGLVKMQALAAAMYQGGLEGGA